MHSTKTCRKLEKLIHQHANSVMEEINQYITTYSNETKDHKNGSYANTAANEEVDQNLLARPQTLPALFRYMNETKRFKSMHGDLALPEKEEENGRKRWKNRKE